MVKVMQSATMRAKAVFPNHATGWKGVGYIHVVYVPSLLLLCNSVEVGKIDRAVSVSYPSSILGMRAFINHHLHILDGMEEHGGQTHATLASQLLLLTTVVINAQTQPAAPEVR